MSRIDGGYGGDGISARGDLPHGQDLSRSSRQLRNANRSLAHAFPMVDDPKRLLADARDQLNSALSILASETTEISAQIEAVIHTITSSEDAEDPHVRVFAATEDIGGSSRISANTHLLNLFKIQGTDGAEHGESYLRRDYFFCEDTARLDGGFQSSGIEMGSVVSFALRFGLEPEDPHGEGGTPAIGAFLTLYSPVACNPDATAPLAAGLRQFADHLTTTLVWLRAARLAATDKPQDGN